MVKLKRVFEDVTRGDMDSRLVLRRGDQAYQELETAFNEMMEAVNERLGSRRGLEAEDDSYSRPESESVLG